MIKVLLAEAPLETESFDWKEMLPYKDKKSGAEAKPERQKLSKTCCAFANSNGGFLIYGIADDKKRAPQDRLVGIPPTVDFLQEFGEYPAKCYPKVAWQSKSLNLENGNFIHIVHIPKSAKAPHCVSQDYNEWHSFPRRTNKGTEYMSYEELRTAILLQEERARLTLILRECEGMGEQMDNKLSEAPVVFRLDYLESLITGVPHTLAEHVELNQAIDNIRRMCAGANELIREKQQSGVKTFDPMRRAWMQSYCGSLRNDCQKVASLLNNILKD
ncbi:MAG TPA: ATP-binding protein [Ktedonobacteraceae bacterium]|nr:ATP-binding protein [Ktedonobacteraceae bacterium]